MKVFNVLSIFWSIFTLYLLLGIVKSLSNDDIVFCGYPDKPKFNHLTIHEDHGTVFIGAVNHLYKLSCNLELLDDVRTNPDENLKNYNKILLINYQKTQLIACGCTTECVCDTYYLNSNSSKLIGTAKKLIGRMEVNSEKTSTVAFISTYNEDEPQKLYIAVSYCRNPENLPSIAVRHLSMENIFEMYKEGVNFDSKAFNTRYRDKYGVSYVYGFDYGRYSYFLTTQRNNTPHTSYVSKLIRICHNEVSLWQGYAEIPIECKLDNNPSYNLIQAAHVGKPNLQLATSLNINMTDDILYAVFSKSQNKSAPSNEPSEHSALCVYSLKTINKKFTENIRNCFNGNDVRGFPSISLDEQCTRTNEYLNATFCSSTVNMPFNGNQPITAAPVITFNAHLTAIVTKFNENHNDVFVGTDRGHLKKIVVTDINSVNEQVDLTIDEGSPVNSDLLFSPNYKYLYVMTAHKLTRIKANVTSVNCSQYEDMRMCFETAPKYCGWCASTTKCSMRCDCHVGMYNSWIPNDLRDVWILKDNSNEFQIEAVVSLLWLATTLPAANERIICVFNIEDVEWSSFPESYLGDFVHAITCKSPQRHELPQIPVNRNYLNATLSISTTTGLIHTKINITFFDCNRYYSCETCISSTFKCEWCPMENKCVYLAADNCAKNNPIELKSIINIPSGLQSVIDIKTNFTLNICGRNLNLKCVIIIEENNYIKNALIKNDNLISCENAMFAYMSNKSFIIAPVSIMLETPTFSYHIINTGVVIYKCQHIAQDYSTCQGVNSVYDCEWCQNTNTCEFRTKCVIEKTNPSISNKQPDEVDVNRPPIKPSQNFKFIDPKITSFSPNQGPIYGGTVLTIKGKNLKPGSSINVFVGNAPCLVILYNSSTIQCITNSSSTETEAKIRVKYDNNIYKSTNDSFKYVKDPQRDSKGYNIQPKGIPGGGVEILIRNVSTVPAEQISFHTHDENRDYSSACEVRSNSDSVLSCLSPLISHIDSDSFVENYSRELNVSFTSNVTNSRTPSDLNNRSLKLGLYPNPRFDYFFNSTVEINDTVFVIIKGENFDKACQKTDIKVKLGNLTCEVRSVSSSQIICSLPKYLSNVTSTSEQEYDFLANHSTIFVSIGASFHVMVPKQSATPPEDPNSTGIIYYAVIFFIIAVIAVVSFFKLERQKVAQALKKLRNTQQHMTRLELRVASECKEAFAELQTQVTTFVVDDSRTLLSYLNYHTYMMNILFPKFSDHSFILTGKTILIHKEEGLLSFRLLIMKRNFLLTFVRTLENEESFTMNDRVFVASLVMITLQKDMAYCTDILKKLLAELIEKYMRGKIHPKLLLRKTESVVEKMLTAWFSFLLYRFLKESAGPPLFNLFNAIKEHVYRGPVDMITSQARYCLSENKILRHKFEFFPLTIYVNISQQTAKIINLESPIEEVPVQVLNCDTISQFKEKALNAIHHTINYSRILTPSELNVEWVYDTSSRSILCDDDSNSIIEGEWRRKNTLGHYGVPNGSILNLISNKETNYRTSDVIPVFNNKESQNDAKHRSSSSFRKIRKKSESESTTALIQGNDPHYKEWHLIKPHDLHDGQEDYDGNDQMIPEIYLTRLLATKSSLQKFVDELFSVILKKNNQNGCFPIAIKYMFDFLDDQARLHSITDPEVVHIWKNNCLPLRFWVNLIKNPNFLFDVDKSNTVDSCLSVIAQVFMDSCSTSEQIFSKDSATTKLLYAKEIPIYNKVVKKYYADIKNMPKITSRDLNAMMTEESNKYAIDFDSNVAVYELSKYAMKYKEKLTDALKNDELAKNDFLATEFLRTITIMSAAADF